MINNTELNRLTILMKRTKRKSCHRVFLVGVVERIFNKKTFLLAGLVAAIALPVGQYLLRDAEAAIPPTMTSVSPNSGPTSGGTQVEITGDNFMTDSTWKQIASGRDHTCAIASDDQAYCWGDNNYGQLGNGDMSLNHSLAPIAVQSSDPGDVLYGKTIKQISAGYYYTCAIASDDQAYCWGDGWSGQLGNDLIGDTPVPVAVDTSGVLSGKTIKQIAPSESHTCAIASDDQAYCWGRGHTGQLGDDLGSNSLVPVAVKNSDPGDVLYGKTIKQIVTGEMHTCAIASDDQAYCWGYGEEGQLGDDYASAGRSDVPVAVDTSGVLNGKTIKQISSGYYHICVIASDDQAYCWGGNWNGVLGNGDDLINYASVPLPVQNSNPGDALYGKTIEQVAAGQSHTCVIASDGQAYCWGMNWFNQLGTDTGYSYISYDPLPVQNSDPGDALYGKVLKQMSAGYQHTCAIASDDQAYCWGDNSHGQLGDGKIGGDGQPMGHGPAAPVIVKSNPSALYGRSVKQVSIGSNHICAIASDDQAYCWGNNNSGQLGNGDELVYDSFLPVAVQNSDPGDALYGKIIKQIATGESHTCAIASDDQAYCWGDNSNGKLGNDDDSGSYFFAPVPVQNSDPGDALYGKTIKQITAGAQHTCAIASDNQVYCWGGSWNGQLGTGDTANSTVPVAVDTSGVLSGKTIKQVSAGESHTCAIASDDQAYCWGNNSYGQFGNDDSTNSPVPVAVDTSGVLSGKTIKQISASYQHTCVIASNDQAYCWGANWSGQLGNDDDSGSGSPVPVAVDTSGVLSGKTIKQIAAGYQHTCVVASDDQAYCWGDNNNGQLGIEDDSTGTFFAPVAVQNSNPSDDLYGKTIKQIAVDYYNTCAIASDDQVYCWGINWAGQLGVDTSTYMSYTPLAIGSKGIPLIPVIESVKFGGVEAISFTVNNYNSITAITPPHIAGVVDVTLTTSGGQVITLTNGYEYLPPPYTIISISPNYGPETGGTNLTITGTGFGASHGVGDGVVLDVSGTPVACDITTWSDTSITCVAPAHAPGLVDVLVTIGGEMAVVPAVCSVGALTACNGVLDSEEERGGDRANIASGFLYEEVYISLLLDTSLVQIGGSGLTPTTPGTFGSGTNIATTFTNHNSGYSLFISTNQANTNPHAKDLKHASLSEYITATNNTCTWNTGLQQLNNTSSALSNNTWGFTLSSTSLTSQQLCQVPDNNSPLQVKSTSSANETGDQTDVFFGARVDLTKPSGHYQSTIVYTAVAGL